MQYTITFLIIGIIMTTFMSFQIVAGFIGSPKIMVVNGYSMSPVFQPFDLLVMDAVEPDDIEVGMIVAVDHRAEGHFFDGGYVVHRVLRTEDRGGELWVSTKGDNNKVADGFVPIEDVVARVVYSIPMIGFVLFPPVNLILSLAFIFLALKSYRKSKALPEV